MIRKYIDPYRLRLYIIIIQNIKPHVCALTHIGTPSHTVIHIAYTITHARTLSDTHTHTLGHTHTNKHTRSTTEGLWQRSTTESLWQRSTTEVLWQHSLDFFAKQTTVAASHRVGLMLRLGTSCVVSWYSKSIIIIIRTAGQIVSWSPPLNSLEMIIGAVPLPCSPYYI